MRPRHKAAENHLADTGIVSWEVCFNEAAA